MNTVVYHWPHQLCDSHVPKQRFVICPPGPLPGPEFPLFKGIRGIKMSAVGQGKWANPTSPTKRC